MNHSESIANLATALVKAQAAMTSAKKDAANPFFKSKYADLGSVVEAIKKPLNDNGISYFQTTDIEETGVVIETVLLHESGEWLSGRLRMPVAKPNDPQALGSAMTYCRRYGLQAIAGVPAEDDDGNNASGRNHAGTKDANNGQQKIISGTHSPTDGALEGLAADRREYCERIASGMVDCFEAGQLEDAYKSYHEVKSNDERVAIWAILKPHSKIRSTIKKMHDAQMAGSQA